MKFKIGDKIRYIKRNYDNAYSARIFENYVPLMKSIIILNNEIDIEITFKKDIRLTYEEHRVLCIGWSNEFIDSRFELDASRLLKLDRILK